MEKFISLYCRYYLWIFALVLTQTLTGWSSFMMNLNKGDWRYIAAYYFAALLPVWTLVAISTKNIVFDGLIYDAVMVFTYTFSIMIFSGSFQTFKINNYLGIVLILIGLVIFKLK